MGPIVAGAFGAGASALGSVFNTLWGNSKSSEEAEKNRKFNAEQARIQREWSERMWNLNNEYNTPSRQMSRYREAGLNPNLLYGQPQAVSQVPQGSSASSGVVGQYTPFDSLGIARAQAEISNINANTRKIEAEADSQYTYNKYQEQLLSNEVASGSVSIHYTEALTSLTEEQQQKTFQETQHIIANVDKIYKEIDKLDSEISKLSSDKELVESETFLNRIKAVYSGRQYEAEISNLYAQNVELYSRAGLNQAHMKEVITMLPFMMSNLSADTLKKIADRLGIQQDIIESESRVRVNDKTSINIDKQNRRLDFDYDNDMTFRSVERGLGVIQGITDMVYRPAELFVSLFGGGSSSPVSTARRMK